MVGCTTVVCSALIQEVNRLVKFPVDSPEFQAAREILSIVDKLHNMRELDDVLWVADKV
jgi:hypothetical protein